MTIYDNRVEPAYRNVTYGPRDWDRPGILKWWTPAHDALLVEQIEEEQWHWYWGIPDKLLSMMPPDAPEWWRKTPNTNILMHFAAARAQKLGLTEAIRKPRWKTCPMCGHEFVEDSLPVPLTRRLGFDQLDFCSPCLSDAVWAERDNVSKEQVIEYLRDLEAVVHRVPSQNFGQGQSDLKLLSTEERLRLLKVLRRKPSLRRVKELFGSWLEALIEAGILEDGTRRTARGTQCVAKDGHVCLSLGEKTIDDLLYALGIEHEKEPRYPEGNYRADFGANGVLIEYFGLKGNPDYDKRTEFKRSLCKKYGIRLIAIYPKDLASSKGLEGKLLKSLDGLR